MTSDCIVDLLRHGETGVKGYCGSLDVPLNKRGWQQMHRTCEVEIEWRAIISSPLQRCAEFANIFSRERDIPLIFDSRLRELHFGDWEGRCVEELSWNAEEELREFWADPWAYTPPNGERLVDFEERINAAYKEYCDLYKGERILWITHGGVIRLMLYLTQQLTRAELLSASICHASLHTVNMKNLNLVCP